MTCDYHVRGNGTYQEVPDVDGGMSAPCAAFSKLSTARRRGVLNDTVHPAVAKSDCEGMKDQKLGISHRASHSKNGKPKRTFHR